MGREVEGSEDRGHITLFIRAAETKPAIEQGLPLAIYKYPELCPVKRVWFCHEFFFGRSPESIQFEMEEALRRFERVCVTFYIGHGAWDAPTVFHSLGKEYPDRFRTYWRIPWQLREPMNAGDFICVGPPFSEETFQVGVNLGTTVKPQDYKDDIFLF